ncbi:NAD(P)/FAD-dependent oxidoreductase [Haloarcula sp. JP-L23]|uniref:NAD(P)/FAD-dependent oxidoreductase n=1 Tax=Haloarcula sp. JP-L23 TaxID=2716717 RepID=UPI00140E9E0B|nr:FAD-dependent oxidoreductase [Haloarcula sp. JP-L23]
MGPKVVTIGSGYAGAGAIRKLEAELDSETELTWISEHPYHLVLHEVHRCIRDPSIRERITIPVEEIASPDTRFREGRVVDVDTEGRAVKLADGDRIDYDYLLVALGSQTEFFGIDGLAEHAHTLKSVPDAVGIHEALDGAVATATAMEPATVVVGGAGLSGVQAAGEIAGFRDERDAALEVHLVEGLDSVLPNSDSELQGALRKRLEAADVTITTGEFIGEVDESTVTLGEDRTISYDVLVWTGGITGPDAIGSVGVETDDRNNRLATGRTFRTTDDRVFALGDCALVDQPGDQPAPPTAQAAWQAAAVAGENVARAIRGQPLRDWTHEDLGTVVSVGERAVATNVQHVPVSTFGGLPAAVLKKAIAARWINKVSGPRRAIAAWPRL